MQQIYGQCSCGMVAYTFVKEKLLAYQCHCSVCQKATGSAFSTTIMAPEKEFEWLRGETIIKSHTKEGGYLLNFCSNCGSTVPNKFRDHPLFSVPAGSIDGKPDVSIALHLHMASRANWDRPIQEGKHFEDMPSLDKILELLSNS